MTIKKLIKTAVFILSVMAQCRVIQATDTTAYHSLSLHECVQLALKQSETLKMTEQDVLAARARYKQAVGTILPDLKFNFTELYQDTNVGNDDPVNRTRSEGKFQAQQPLFNGFKEFSAMSGYKRDIQKNEFTRRRTVSTIYQDVAGAFFEVARLETAEKNTDILIRLTEDRIRELNKDARLGKSRESEVLAAEAQVSNLNAVKAQLQGPLSAARELLGFLCGEMAAQATLQYQLERETNTVSLDDALHMGTRRYDLESERQNVEGKRYALRYAGAGYWPSIFARGHYYTKRYSYENVDWDILLNVDVPIFQGGRVRGAVREARTEYVKAQLATARLEREIASAIKTAHVTLTASIEESKKLEEAYDKSRRSYEMQLKDYRLGLVDNLMVLQAMKTMQEVKQDLDRSLLATQLNLVKLKVAMEDVPIE